MYAACWEPGQKNENALVPRSEIPFTTLSSRPERSAASEVEDLLLRQLLVLAGEICCCGQPSLRQACANDLKSSQPWESRGCSLCLRVPVVRPAQAVSR